MGAGESREEKKLEGLPLVKNKYRMISVLGQGNFGGVYKVQHKKNKKFYALKCVPVDAQPGTNENQQKVVYQTALTEKQLLKGLKHANIVRLYDSFVIPRNPAMKKVKKKKKKKNRWFCLLLEYCHGNTLEAVLQKVEEDKKEKEKARKEEQKGKKTNRTMGKAVTKPKSPKGKGKTKEKKERLFIPKDLCLMWFIKLLETVAYVHKHKIIHADLHPENILLTYQSLNDYKNIDLKVSDFGVAKDIKKELPRDLSGQIFYAAPEAVSQIQYDSRADMWSLGVIFLNCYAQLSMDSYIKFIQKIFFKIKTVPTLRKKFCDRYKIKNEMAVHQVPWITLICFMHERRLFEGVINQFIDDTGVRSVLSKMMCPYEERLYAADLIKTKTIQTWMYLLDRTGKIKVDDFDLAGVVTIMKLPDPFLFTRCLQILKVSVLDAPLDFVNNSGISVMLKRTNGLREMYKRRYLKDIISITMKVLGFLKIADQELYDKTLREIVVSFREYGCVQTLEKLLMFQNNDNLYYFTYLICSKSKTIRNTVCKVDNVRNLLLKMKRRNEDFITAIITALIPAMKEEELEVVTSLYKKTNVSFFRKCKLRHRVFNKVLKSLFQEMLKETDEKSGGQGVVMTENKKEEDEEETEEEKMMIELLSTVIFMVQNHDSSTKTHEDFHLKKNRKLSQRCKLDFGRGFKTMASKILIDTKKFSLECKTKEIAKGKPIEVVSSETLCLFKNMSQPQEKETCIAYFEIEVLNGGYNDDIIIGFHATQVKPCQILLQANSGFVGIVDFGKKEVREEKNPAMLCESGSTIGCGITCKGRVFWTKDNKMYPYVQFLPAHIKKYSYAIPLKASIKFNGNLGFKGRVNFGFRQEDPPFAFKFASITPKREIKWPRGVRKPEKRFQINKNAVNCIKHEADPGGLILQKVKLHFADNEFIQELVKKIDSFGSDQKKNDEEEEEEEGIDDELSDIYNEQCHIEKKVVKTYENSAEYKKDFEDRTKKKGSSSKSMISSMYSEIRKGISERKNQDEEDDDDDDEEAKKKKENPGVQRVAKLEKMRGKNRNSVADFFAANFFASKDGENVKNMFGEGFLDDISDEEDGGGSPKSPKSPREDHQQKEKKEMKEEEVEGENDDDDDDVKEDTKEDTKVKKEDEKKEKEEKKVEEKQDVMMEDEKVKKVEEEKEEKEEVKKDESSSSSSEEESESESEEESESESEEEN